MLVLVIYAVLCVCQVGMTSEFEGSSSALAGLLDRLKQALTAQIHWQKTIVEILKGNLDSTVSMLQGVVDSANPIELDAQVRWRRLFVDLSSTAHRYTGAFLCVEA